ncbi:B-cell receptor CD22-like [Triplophysa rosa]|uniref:B-cell receptor CD22-like n=1 Tax=Triplophysa rosa TaxID=992332 RepID=UPI0025461BA7|nr:B-cell receptor CD22-like [Triplophysa rosa]
MAMCFTISLMFLLMTADVDGQWDWGVNYNPSYVCALRGSTVRMSCFYPPDYWTTAYWSKETYVPGVAPPNLCSDTYYSGRAQCLTNSISLTHVTEADEDIYYCGYNGGWSGYSRFQLSVTDLQVETQQRVKEGDSVTLTCKTTCRLTEETTFIWSRNTQILTEHTVNEIHLQSVSRHDSGLYKCAAGRRSGRLYSPDVHLDVRYAPRNVVASISSSGVIVEGDSVTLTCSSDSNPPVQQYNWFKGETSVGSRKIYSITNIRSDQSGEYKCKTRNKHGEKYSEAVMLNVMYAPRNVVASISSSGVIVEGDSVTLTCSSESNPPVQQYSWFEGETSVGSGNIFKITSVRSDQNGEYKCKANNNLGEKYSKAVTLNVMYAPRNVVASISSSGVIVEGDSVTLTCSSESNPPVQQYSWFEGETSVGSGNIFKITSVRSDQNGEYKCKANNNLGEKYSKAVTLNVMYAPRNVSASISSSGVIVEGDSVTLTCSSESNPPVHIYSWFKENQTSSVGSGQTFSITNINSRLSGWFYCVAQNKHGSQRSAAVSLTVKGVRGSSLYTVFGIVAGCVGFFIIIIIIIILIIKKRRTDSRAEYVNQTQTADSSDDRYTALKPASRTSADIYSTIRSDQCRADDGVYMNLQSRSSEYDTLKAIAH